MPTSKRYFAVGLKGWVQIRVAAKPPKGVTSSVATTVKHRQLHWIPGRLEGDRWIPSKAQWIVVPRKMTLKATTYEGGRTIQTIKTSKFSSLIKVGVRDGGMIELMPEQVDLLKGAGSGREK